jgi:CBS domain-containing protein
MSGGQGNKSDLSLDAVPPRCRMPGIIKLALFEGLEQNIYWSKTMGEELRSTDARKRCHEIMTGNVTTATPDMSLQQVAVLLRDGDMGSVPVVEAGRLRGIVTDRDIVVRAIAQGNAPGTAISEAMSTDLFTVRPDDFVFEAIRLMGDKQVRRIPVVSDDGSLVGIISMADIALDTDDERQIAETLEDVSSGTAFWKKS